MDIQDVVRKNRETLSSVDCFITDENHNNSPDNYGLPLHVRHLIDLPINKDLTYVDILRNTLDSHCLSHYLYRRVRFQYWTTQKYCFEWITSFFLTGGDPPASLKLSKH